MSVPPVASELGLRVPAADGTLLLTDVHRPPGRRPIVVLRTPYGTGSVAMLQLGRFLAREGFAAVLQNVRGRYGSQGTFEPFCGEAEDGAATLRWLSEQSWCDGTVVPFGISYSTFTAAALLADEPPPGLRFPGMVAIAAMVRPWRHFYRGGALVLHWALPWALAIAGQRQSIARAEELRRHVRAPLVELSERLGAPPRPWQDWIRESEAESPYWRQRDLLPLLAQRGLPMLHLGGWYDFSLASTFELYQAMAARVPAAQRLVVGPWEHNQIFATLLAELRGVPPDAAGGLAVPFLATLRAWCGADAQLPLSPVRLWQRRAHGGRWLELPAWPPEASSRRWYLSSPNGARASGRLSLDRAEGSGPDIVWRHDPDDPVPTCGGRLWAMPGWTESGALDQQEVEQRDDVVLYTSEPLAGALEVAGTVRAQLRLASEPGAPAEDTFVKLVDVGPDGSALWVADGVVRCSAGSPTPRQVTVELGELCYCFPPGHRLRLEVAASSFPQFDRTLGPGWCRLVHNGAASWLELPIREA